MTHDTTHSILQSAGRFFSGTLISRVSGLIRDIAMAYAFGTGAHIAAFLIAYRFAHLLRRLFGEGAMQSAFVPLFESLKSENPGRARRFYFDLQKLLAAVLTGVIALGAAGLLAYLFLANPPSSREEVALLTLIMLPSLLFICLYGLNASLLQCHHIYFIPGIAPVIFNLVWTAAVLMLMQMPETRAMPYLAASIILASLGQWLFTWPKSHAVISNYPADSSSNKGDLWKIGTPMLLGTLGVAATQINNFMDAVFARFASLDGPAFLWYAVRLEQLPLALFGIALSGAVLPPLARAYKSGNMKQYQEFIDYALKRTSLLLIPISFAMVLLGSTGISIIYARGDFGIDSIAGTTACLFAYAIGLWPMGMVQILAPAFYARGNYRKPTQASIIVMALNIVLNGWFVFGLGWSATSIALATSLSAWVNMILLGFGLIRRDAITRPWALSGKIAWVALASVAGAALVLLLDNHALSPLPVQAITLLGKDLVSRSFLLIKNGLIFAVGTGCVLILAKLKN